MLYTPLRVEQAALRRAARSMRLVRTGMGPQRAAAAAALSASLKDPASLTDPVFLTDPVSLADSAPVLVAGVGGGLAPQVRPGDVVVASEIRGDGLCGVAACPGRGAAWSGRGAACPGGVAAHRRVEVPSAPLLADALRRLGLTVHVGPILSSHRILRGVARQRAAAAHGGLLAVDMESAALAPAGAFAGAAAVARTAAAGATGDARTATTARVPFAVVRVIVDSVDHPLWRVGTLRRGVRALRTLRACLPALEWWAAAMAATDRRSTTEEEVI